MFHSRFCATVVLMACVSVHAHATTPPPLKPNEKIVTTRDGCGFVIDESKPSAKFDIERISKLTWGGPCVNGLAMGEGWVFEGDHRYLDIPARKGWLWYGRGIGPSDLKVGSGPASFSFTWDGRTVSYNTLSTSQPVWTAMQPGEMHRRSRVNDGEIMVIANTRGCILERKTFPECERENKFEIPGVQVFNLAAKTNQFHACPNPRSAQGCEALWAQHAGPVIERIKAFISENTPKVVAAKREAAPLIAAWRPSPGAQQATATRHAALRAEHLAERRQREEKMADMQRNLERLKAENAARQAEIDRQNAIAEQERKEARRKDRQEAMGVWRNYANTSASMGNNKPANRLSRLEALTGKPPEGETRVSTVLNTYADRLNRKYPDSPSSPPATSPTSTGSPTPPTSSSRDRDFYSREFPVATLTHCVKTHPLPNSLGRRYYGVANACSVEIICLVSTFIDGKKQRYREAGCGLRGLAPNSQNKSPDLPKDGSLSTSVEWACPSKAAVEQQIGKKLSGVRWVPNRGCVATLPPLPVGTAR